ncbi:hypothetical protein [Aquimarina algicola]|uniref:Uncharacterized protein n=1 Tax=Aquimarina algicola TaxID=2589995 RepID=A0A504JDQ1_9FLAO|nr:hypothetical protein [Aquimarina algicola]TPN88844.1 hypothetical protein FHK87_01120 [Aquimarina algicola]
MSKINVLDKRLIEEYVAYYPSSELLDDDLKKAQPVVRVTNGITYRFYPKAYINVHKKSIEYLVIQLSAKMLKKNYFDGIQASNIRAIYNDIMDFGIFWVDFNHFLDGLVTDIDICINQNITPKEFQVAQKMIKTTLLPAKEPLVWFPNRENNIGIEFNKRDKATPSIPHMIAYYKGAELLDEKKSLTFYKAYLEPMPAGILNNLFRFEFTIKSSKHFAYLRKKGVLTHDLKTLNDLLSIPSKELYSIAKTGIPLYTRKREVSHSTEGLKPMDIAIRYYIEKLIELGFDTERLVGFIHDIDCPVARSRTKTKVKKIINSFTSVSENSNRLLQRNDNAGHFLSKLGFKI